MKNPFPNKNTFQKIPKKTRFNLDLKKQADHGSLLSCKKKSPSGRNRLLMSTVAEDGGLRIQLNVYDVLPAQIQKRTIL